MNTHPARKPVDRSGKTLCVFETGKGGAEGFQVRLGNKIISRHPTREAAWDRVHLLKSAAKAA